MTDKTAMTTVTGAQALVAQLHARGVRHIYGVPGGDCSLDIIDAAHRRGIEFVLARNENAAAMMAAAGAEITGTLGVLLTTRGPGLANGVNGVACAMLDRCGLVVISDGYENEQGFVSHQRFDQQRVLEPIVKGSLRVDSPSAALCIGGLLDRAMSRPRGPVYLEVTGKGMRSTVPAVVADDRPGRVADLPDPPAAMFEAAAGLIARARRPVLIVGLQTRDPGAAQGVRALVAQWRCPVLSTYMGKGAMPDADPMMVGHFMAGGAERELMTSADLIVTIGLDPIELLPKAWAYEAPIIELSTCGFDRHHFVPAVGLVGDLGLVAGRLAAVVSGSAWRADEVASLRSHMQARATGPDGEGISPTLLSRTASECLPERVRITVDAGAHMLPVMAFCQARNPCDVLISRGLATMGYALPTAIGAALARPDVPVVAFTGDGGLMMCASELATAAQMGCRLTVVVFNDSAIAMIGVKQGQRGLTRRGMDYSDSDFSIVARGYGCTGYRVDTPGALESTLRRAFDEAGPTVVDVVVDHRPYGDQLKSLRG